MQHTPQQDIFNAKKIILKKIPVWRKKVKKNTKDRDWKGIFNVNQEL